MMTPDDFNHFLDVVWWEGFAEQYAKEHPEEYTQELNQFLDMHTTRLLTFKPIEK